MARDLTDDDRGKSVVSADGNHLGTVADIREGRAQVETADTTSAESDDDSGLTEKLKSALGWDDDEADTHELRNDDIDSVNDNQVKLRNQY